MRLRLQPHRRGAGFQRVGTLVADLVSPFAPRKWRSLAERRATSILSRSERRQSTPMSVIIVTATDERFFDWARGTIESIRAQPQGREVAIGSFDLGCTD